MSAELFARHLDLTLLGPRRRGLVRCIFHAERTASLSVDLDAGVFHCFGCGAEGGVKRFAAMVGEAAPVAARHDGPYRWPIDEARAEVVRQARRQPWTWAREEYSFNAAVRDGHRQVAALRARGHAAQDWDLLAEAARLETAVHNLEALL